MDTGLAALEEKAVTLDEEIDCENIKQGYFQGFKISTWRAHGLLPFAQVIEKSNNIGVAKVAQRLAHKLYDHYRTLGFGTKTGLNWPGEQAGFVNPPHLWSRQSIISLSFGYELSATLAQLARAFAVIANNGHAVPLRLVASADMQTAASKQLYSPHTIEAIRTILTNTVSQGTARKASLAEFAIAQGITVMGKTGTANMVVDGSYNTQKNTYTFGCIVEKGSYKRVIVTFVKEIAYTKDVYASSVAVPVCQKIIQDMILHDRQY